MLQHLSDHTADLKKQIANLEKTVVEKDQVIGRLSWYCDRCKARHAYIPEIPEEMDGSDDGEVREDRSVFHASPHCAYGSSRLSASFPPLSMVVQNSFQC